MTEYLHSHSAIERELNMSKHKVLVDARFIHLFKLNEMGEVFTKRGIKYVEVDTSAFLKKGGVFKNFRE